MNDKIIIIYHVEFREQKKEVRKVEISSCMCMETQMKWLATGHSTVENLIEFCYYQLFIISIRRHNYYSNCCSTSLSKSEARQQLTVAQNRCHLFLEHTRKNVSEGKCSSNVDWPLLQTLSHLCRQSEGPATSLITLLTHSPL